MSSDKIGVVAFRAARLTSLLRPDDHARDGSNGLLEVYPAAALKRWSLSSRGYKLPENTAERSSILAALQHRVDLDLGGLSDGLTRSSDRLDALVSSMVARAYFLGDTDAIPDEHRNEAAVEGWILLPSGGGSPSWSKRLRKDRPDRRPGR